MMPKGADPDSFVREHGAEAFWGVLRKSKGLFEYKLEVLRRRNASDALEVKARIAGEMLQTISRIGNAV